MEPREIVVSGQQAKGWMRTAMPTTAAFIDAMRETFGADQVDPSIRAGMAGVPGKFWARENGNEIGTPIEGRKSNDQQ